MTRNQKMKYLVGSALLMGATASHAVIDVSVATTGIADAGTAIGAVLAALMTLSVTILGLVKVYNFVSRKAGA